MKKVFNESELPEFRSIYRGLIKPDRKKFFYIGRYTNQKTSQDFFKFGITRDVKTRLKYLKKAHPNFKLIKIFRINNPKQLEDYAKEWLIDNRCEHQLLTNMVNLTYFIRAIKTTINDSFHEYKPGRFNYLHKRQDPEDDELNIITQAN